MHVDAKNLLASKRERDCPLFAFSRVALSDEEDLASFVTKSGGVQDVLRSADCGGIGPIIRYPGHSVRFRISKHHA